MNSQWENVKGTNHSGFSLVRIRSQCQTPNFFYSEFRNKNSAGVDSFTFQWSDRFGLFVPLICVLHRVILKMRREKVKGVLDLPFWESAMFWPMVCRRQEFFPFVKECMDLPVSKEFYTRCKNGSALFGNKDFDFGMLAFYVDISILFV